MAAFYVKEKSNPIKGLVSKCDWNSMIVERSFMEDRFWWLQLGAVIVLTVSSLVYGGLGSTYPLIHMISGLLAGSVLIAWAVLGMTRALVHFRNRFTQRSIAKAHALADPDNSLSMRRLRRALKRQHYAWGPKRCNSDNS